MFRFGVHSLIWTEDCTVKDLPLIRNAKSLGFAVLDLNVASPEWLPHDAGNDKWNDYNCLIDIFVTNPC